MILHSVQIHSSPFANGRPQTTQQRGNSKDKKEQQIRGYNQSEWIARGIAAVTGIPIDTESILRKKNTETQTRKSVFERRDNVEGIFELQHPETLAGKHILIVDDVLTTGSTTLACASCLVDVEDIRISILTLAMVE